MSDISNDNICFFDDPSVSMGNCVFGRNVFQRRIKNHIKTPFFIIDMIFLILFTYIRCYKYKIYSCMIFFEFFCTLISKKIKAAIFTKKEINCSIF